MFAFSAPKMAAFEVHMLGREAACDDYTPEAIAAGDAWFQRATDDERAALLVAVM